MLCGVLFRTYEYKSWFALSNYEIDAQSQELEQRLWDIFPIRSVHFWPYLMKDSDGFGEFLERDMPVSVKTEMYKLGKFKTEIKWLEPWVKVQWRNKLWYISRDGKMWALDDDINRNFHGNDPKIIWKIADNVTSDGNNDTVPLFGVFKTPLATETMENFLNEFREYSWFQYVSEVMLGRRAGADLFTLKLENNKQKFEVLIQLEKYTDLDLGLLIQDVFERLAKEGGNYVIDATYNTGKISLRPL